MAPNARWALGLLLIAGCAPAEDDALEETGAGLGAPSSVIVNGVRRDLESDYLPHVVECENGDAPTESKKAQAIAARTFLMQETRGQRTPRIGDGQRYQVYTCGRPVSQHTRDAVSATRGVYLAYAGAIANGQYVSGALVTASCSASTDPTRTERFVTRNEGRTGSQVRGAPYPLATAVPWNRGCMGQHLANCLDKVRGYDAASILRFFYGLDIEIMGDVSAGGAAPTPAPAPAEQPAKQPSSGGASGDPPLVFPCPERSCGCHDSILWWNSPDGAAGQLDCADVSGRCTIGGCAG